MLVVIDDYSRYPELELVQSTSAATFTLKMEKLIASQGLFGEVRTDNRPFNSREWADFLKSRNTKQHRIMPRRPQVNGEVECFVRTLTKVIRITTVESQNVESAIYTFLREYRVTPMPIPGPLQANFVLVGQ
ncbi:hypothetical protein NDU88_004280 [Pleurodeles waltl]|uniref:Integrase catalytic domain-containing protein n=1 Tax=Pleurodeles waltl TaxID=8319 RepID=A0AAV7PCH7_PLEWA|nr:hypothetical protein NDU88_004280 [Pleurodeles waltl]